MVYPITKFTILPFIRLFIREVKGLENIPKKGPFIIAVNHSSYLDPLVICSVIVRKINRKVHFIALRDNAHRNFWILGDTICRKWAGCIPIDRADKGKYALNEAVRYLKGNKIVAIFPLAELSERIPRPKTGVVRLALDSKAPLVPCYLCGTSEILPPLRLIPKKLKRSIRLRIGKPIYLGENNNANKKDLRKLADKVVKEIYSLSK